MLPPPPLPPSSPMSPTLFHHHTAGNCLVSPPILPLPYPLPNNPHPSQPKSPYLSSNYHSWQPNQAPPHHPAFYPHHTNLTLNRPYPSPNHFSRWSRKHVSDAINNDQILNVYVENIHSRWTSIDIHLILTKFGEILDVYITAKLSKLGKRFSFVRFKKTSAHPEPHCSHQLGVSR
ncbi:hypothetical protein Tsubulata_023053 [Turnera subulata]|uniref:RRM domain-containing protein n=1 Tax=Turnera subulata TaxID=218843 RepID=A0A9Q0FFB9_9ROSI|nr:hypothetical protein Tsubulata_023053 [Turnera subulata]